MAHFQIIITIPALLLRAGTSSVPNRLLLIETYSTLVLVLGQSLPASIFGTILVKHVMDSMMSF